MSLYYCSPERFSKGEFPSMVFFFFFHCVAQLWGYHTGLYQNYNILLTSLVFLGSDPHGFLCRDVLSSGLHKLKHFKETERILGWYLFW